LTIKGVVDFLRN